MADFKKQMKKGILELAVLSILNEEDRYGYSIIQYINKKSEDKLIIKDGTLYPILYRLEDSDMIESYWETGNESRSKPRKYYKITSKGQEDLRIMIEEYLDINLGITKILDI